VRSPPTQLGRSAAVLAILALAALIGAVLARGVPVDAHPHPPFVPNDEGAVGQPAGWTRLQWNFAGPYGVDAPGAWANLIAADAPGGAGVTVAVLDTGVAYLDRGLARRSPDLGRTSFVQGYDFVEDDPYPLDESGHGTHVASTIAEETDNEYGLTGLAYGVRLMPVRVLDRAGNGDAVTIARGLRFAADHGAKIINLSLNFDTSVTADRIPQILAAIAYANRRGSLVVTGAGNTSDRVVAEPARAPHVLSVGATTVRGCLSSFSNYGSGLDLVAPGGGDDAALTEPNCQTAAPGSEIYQISLVGLYGDRFGIRGMTGTSMAAPHVSATAALVVASGVLGPDPAPEEIEARLEQTARDLGRRGYDPYYGWGLVNAAAATASGSPRRPAPVATTGSG
jgi:serine protease